MCERLWRIAQNCAKKQGLATGSRRWLTTASHQNVAHGPSMPETEELRQLLHYRTKVPGWPSRLLATWTRDSTQLRGRVARTSCLGKTSDDCAAAFQQLKEYLSRLLIMSSLEADEVLYAYIAVAHHAVSLVLIRDDNGLQKPVY